MKQFKLVFDRFDDNNNGEVPASGHVIVRVGVGV